ncbi:MAG: DUF1282 domain-containing protein [Bacteroidetes bacterium]|nr:MAG: DUF1282 domain-containing protein [Bacteroidota bacterium]
MDINHLFQIVKTLLASPEKGWGMIKEANYSWQQIFGYFLVPLIFASSLATIFFLGNRLLETPLSPNQMFFITFAGTAGAVLLSAWMIAAMAPRFEGVSSLDETVALIAFSYTPVFLGSIVSSLHPALQVINLATLVYMLFLFFKGTASIIRVPTHKQMGFIITSIIIIFAVRLIISVVLATLMGGFRVAM